MTAKNKLNEMSLHELWKLFPIALEKHNSKWRQWYEDEVHRITSILSEDLVRISHIGSTAIKGIQAKPIIDILVELTPNYTLSKAKDELINHGYICMSEEPNRISLNRGYTEKGFAEKAYHVHLRHTGGNAEISFRGYLIDHPAVAKEYERLKFSLQNKYKHNRDAYTNAKTEFITKYTAMAIQLYKVK